MQAEQVITDANIVTMLDGPGARADALAIDRGRIVAVGTADEVLAAAGPGTRILSLPGKTVLPGFIDAHVHLMQMGLALLGPNADELRSVDGLRELVAVAARQAPEGEPVTIHSCNVLRLDRPLTRVECDRMAPQHPLLVLEPGGHSCVANSLAWSALGLPCDTHGVKLDPDTGLPDGLLCGRANRLARYRWSSFVSDETRRAALRRATALAAAGGITTVHAMEGGDPGGHGRWPERDLEVLLDERAGLPVRTVVFFQSTDVARTIELGLPRIGGCLCLDGAYNDHTAAFREPYTDDPTTRGTLYFADEALQAFVSRAHNAGLQISLHAIGDAAIDQLLNAYERALLDEPRVNHRHRIEHFSLPTLQQIEKAARLGVAVAMQPNFAYIAPRGPAAYSPAALRLLGPNRYAWRHPYRKIVDAGVLVAGGTSGDPAAPLFGVHALVNHPDEVRRLGVCEALALYTVNAARIGFEEQNKGTIEAGKLADLVVLDGDPLTADPATLKDIPICLTLVGGKIVYAKERVDGYHPGP